MAPTRGSQLMAFCAVAAFIWLSRSIEGHPLIDHPRLSASLVLLIAGALAFIASFFSVWLPGSNGRFDDGPALPLLQRVQSNLPKRPRRYFIPVLVAAVVLRLELFHRVTYDLQCSAPGIECFLPLLLLAYELLPGRRPRPEARELDDIPKTLFEDCTDWFRSLEHFRPLLIIGTTLLSCGAYLISSRSLKSTFFCSARDNAALVTALQWLGLLLDAAIVVLFWRVLAWTRTTRSRLKTMSGILMASSWAVGFLLLGSYLLRRSGSGPYDSTALDSLYIFDALADGFGFFVFAVASGLAVCEDGPSNLSATVVFSSALLAVVGRILLVGTWENIWRLETNAALTLVCVGFSVFAYTSGMRSVLLIHRAVVVVLVFALIVASVVFTLVKGPAVDGRHPLERLIYDARIEADRWLVHATVSGTLRVAVDEYRERNHGRDPPPKFDVWHEFATARNSPIIDHFAQIGSDILPFWAFAPHEIRQGTAMVASQPDMALVRVQGGAASHKEPPDSPHRAVLDHLTKTINTFAKHLPGDMELAVNLGERPRVLAPWIDTHRFGEAGKSRGLSRLISRRSAALDAATGNDDDDGSALEAPPRADVSAVDHRGGPVSAAALRQMTALACDPESRARSGVYWNVQSFCSACIRPQSRELFLRDWDAALDLCHQPDLSRLHGLHAAAPDPPPVEHLLPVFSRSKTSSYSDILVPLARADEVGPDGVEEPDGLEEEAEFSNKADRLVWRGDIDAVGLADHDRLHGGHNERLVHLVNNATSADRALCLLPIEGDRERFAYESVPVPELNAALPLDVGVREFKCGSSKTLCEAARLEFGEEKEEEKEGEKDKEKKEKTVVDSRYVLLTDSGVGGPATGFLRALRSTSVPFVASVFREWHTERLRPWVHFVPVDIRYQALHSTLAYFTGLRGRGIVNGREMDQPARLDDAQWISEQGRRWAGRALRREDREVYLFRLLLEWGRLIDDDRDKMGFRLE